MASPGALTASFKGSFRDVNAQKNAPKTAGQQEYGLHMSFAEASVRVEVARNKKKAGKKDEAPKNLKREVHMDEHIIELSELCERLGTDQENGLTSDKAAELLKQHGKNMLTPPKGIPWYVTLAKHMFGGFALLLWIAAALSFIAYGINQELAADNLYIGIVLVIVVVITGGFSFYQEAKSLSVMKGFSKMVPTQALVIRDGQRVQLNAEQLTIGDLVEIRLGQKVPADLRIIEAQGLKVDNSSFTGEPEPQSRIPVMTDENPLETKNIAFYTTSVIEGTGKGIVINVGDNTVIGHIAGLATGVEAEQTPIALEIEHLVRVIAAIAVSCGLIFLIIALARFGVKRAEDVIKAVVFSIGIIVGAVPEGLLATVTVALTLTAKRMARKMVLVKNLESVETLGSTSAICSDKTGTLTQNRMTAAHLWYNDEVFTTDTSVTKGNYDTESATFKVLHHSAALCNTAEFDPSDMDAPLITRKCTSGNATEYALLKFVHPLRDIYEHRGAFPLVATLPFNSTNKWALSLHRDTESGEGGYDLYMKGAPERVIDLCTHIMINGKKKKLSSKWKKKFTAAYEELGGAGERVIGFATRHLDRSKFPDDFLFDVDELNFPVEKLTFVGLISLIDPPREAVPAAVKACQTSKIKIIMVTGDHPLTAKAIAHQVGILRDDTREDIAKREGIKPEEVKSHVRAIVVTGTELATKSEAEIDEIIKHEQIVFARTSPQQKLIIVEGVQRAGHIVAVTGDGVNDSPALRKADIGIAMGIEGSDVSKEAADMILLDDNFASIVLGVEQGRTIFDNLKKSIAYKLTANVPELIPFVLYVAAQMPLMLSTVLILCIDIGTDMWPAIALAYERPESDIMERAPRNPKVDKLVTGKLITFAYLLIGVVQAIAGLYTFMVVMGDGAHMTDGIPPTSIFGLLDEFTVRVHPAEYHICRISNVAPRHLVACLPTPAELDAAFLADPRVVSLRASDADYDSKVAAVISLANSSLPEPMENYPHWDRHNDTTISFSTAGIRAGLFYDYCYNDVNTRATPTKSLTHGYYMVNNTEDLVLVNGVNLTKGARWYNCLASKTVSRLTLNRMGQSAYFLTVVICQWACLFMCKTRWVSFFQQGIHNLPLVLGWIFENVLTVLIIYVPFLQEGLLTGTVEWQWWFPPIPFMLAIFAFDEFRKLIMRKYPDGWVKRHTYY